MLRATSGLAEQLRETTIFGIFPLGEYNPNEPEYNPNEPVGTLLAFTPEEIVVGF